MQGERSQGTRWHRRTEAIECCQSFGPLTAGAWLDLDLLRRRREELGLQELSSLPVTQLLVRGSVVGGGLVVQALLIMLVLFEQWRLAVGERRQQTPLALEYDRVLLKLQDSRRTVETTTGLNRRMADTVAGVRSGSALLTELQLLLPETMRYQLIAAKGNRLELSGEAQAHGPGDPQQVSTAPGCLQLF